MKIRATEYENGDFSVVYNPKAVRSNKGKSLLELPLDYVMVDLETTGLDPMVDEIIEIGAIKYKNGIEVSRFQTLVKPESPISDFISQLTGITNEMVCDAPKIENALPQFLEYVGSQIVLGYNVNFDINFLYDNCEYAGLPSFSNDFVDVYRICRRVFRDLPNHKLKTVCDYLNIPQPIEHRAIADCIRTENCYQIMKSKVESGEASLIVKSPYSYNSLSKSIVSDSAKNDPDNELYGKSVAFTGTLQLMTRRDAMQKVADIGGICSDGVTRDTNYLVLGNNEYCKSIKGGKSSKQKKAEKMQLDGFDISIISENVFYELIGEQLST